MSWKPDTSQHCASTLTASYTEHRTLIALVRKHKSEPLYAHNQMTHGCRVLVAHAGIVQGPR